MNGGAHMFIGAASVVALNYYYPFLPSGWIPLGMAVGAGVLGALLPDIDHPNSTISHDLHVARGDGPLGCAGCLGGVFRAMMGGHRGATHSLLFVGVCLVLVWYLVPLGWRPYGLAFTLGYASHLVADLGHGVPLAWPISRRLFKVWR